MSLPYIPGHIIDEAKDRRRQGDSLATLASRLGVSPEALATLLGEPSQRPAQQTGELDLWAADKMQEVL
jgi:hypothetical protein